MENLKKTPLFPMHQKYGGKIIDFGGWALPVQFTGILEEHEAVRRKAGLFDVSHMGEVEIIGTDAEAMLQKLVVGDVSVLKEKQVLYSLMCYPDGGVVDDLLIYKYNINHYLLVINAANTEIDYQWIMGNLRGNVQATNVSDHYAQLALQGPLAEHVLQKITNFSLEKMNFFYFEPEVQVNGISCLISRTGYTGEDGFELYLKPEAAPEIWDKILAVGQEGGVLPVGLGARDTLRFEAKLPLYGQELAHDITPLEAGLSFFVKLDKADFIGKDALIKQKEQGVPRKLVGFEMIDRGVPRSHYTITLHGEVIGFVTSGTFSPTLKKNVGLALVKAEHAEVGNEIEVDIRNKKLKAKIVPTPFYKKHYKL